jgi:hypothetical protein
MKLLVASSLLSSVILYSNIYLQMPTPMTTPASNLATKCGLQSEI